MAYLLGYDIGSSSIKASVLEVESGRALASISVPEKEMPIQSPYPGFAEQDPNLWWNYVVEATHRLHHQFNIDLKQVKGIGISYQMHGLVVVDQTGSPLIPAIIWCDSRAVTIGEKAYQDMGPPYCQAHFLNSPGNFTASKLKWVMEHDQSTYKKIHKMMLPGDYIAFKMTGEIKTTPSGLSEGILWDYQSNDMAFSLLKYYGIDETIIPERIPVFSTGGAITAGASKELNIPLGTPVSYRAGDQLNNAFSLNVLNPGEIAATAGTSGVVYGVSQNPVLDPQSRINTFVHVNHNQDNPRYGVLLCVNGTGILNRWIKENIMDDTIKEDKYNTMNREAQTIPIGSDGVIMLPYGNGAERTLGNKNILASIHGLDFNKHTKSHLFRAAQEGILFALKYGLDIMKNQHMPIKQVRAGHSNMFLSELFAKGFATLNKVQVQLYNTDGSIGAARGAGVGAGIYSSFQQAFKGLETIQTIQPNPKEGEQYQEAYYRWEQRLKHYLERP